MDARSPIVVTNAFSKGLRMYARRVGYGVVPREFVHPLTTMQDHTLLTTDSVPQSILNAAHVDTVPGSDFGLSGTIRLSYSASQFEDAIDRLAAYFEDGS